MRGPAFWSRLLFVPAAVLAASSVQAELIYGVTDAASLRTFDSATPGTQTTIGTITGLAAGQTLRGIDFRPATGALYAIATDSTGGTAQMYTVNLATGAAAAAGPTFGLTGNTSTRVSIDFNPAADRLRIVTSDTVENNFRWNPQTNAFVQADGTVLYDAGDVNFPDNPPFVSSIAYTNNVAGAASTTLYGYDFVIDNVLTIGSLGGTPISPNTGTSFSVGGSGVVANSAGTGMDISGVTGLAYMNMDTTSANDNFYTLNLGTGAVTLVGTLGTTWLDISAAPAPIPEPASLGVLALGLTALAARRRRA